LYQVTTRDQLSFLPTANANKFIASFERIYADVYRGTYT
jgi:hypothetical protein